MRMQIQVKEVLRFSLAVEITGDREQVALALMQMRHWLTTQDEGVVDSLLDSLVGAVEYTDGDAPPPADWQFGRARIEVDAALSGWQASIN